MKKFVMEVGWIPKKLDVYVDVPDIIDISQMRSKGRQPGEKLLPESGDDGEVESKKLSASDGIVSQLVSMGFTHLHCQKAAIRTSNAGIEEAMKWLHNHMEDPDIDAPMSQDADSSTTSVDQSKRSTLWFHSDFNKKWHEGHSWRRVVTSKEQLIGYLAILMLQGHLIWLHLVMELRLLIPTYQMEEEVSF